MRKKLWETSWNQRKDTLDQHRQLCQFNTDLHQINETLDDLSRQLAGVKGQYGESIASAKATSLAFVYFEKTIEVNLFMVSVLSLNKISFKFKCKLTSIANTLVCKNGN